MIKSMNTKTSTYSVIHFIRSAHNQDSMCGLSTNFSDKTVLRMEKSNLLYALWQVLGFGILEMLQSQWHRYKSCFTLYATEYKKYII